MYRGILRQKVTHIANDTDMFDTHREKMHDSSFNGKLQIISILFNSVNIQKDYNALYHYKMLGFGLYT